MRSFFCAALLCASVAAFQAPTRRVGRACAAPVAKPLQRQPLADRNAARITSAFPIFSCDDINAENTHSSGPPRKNTCAIVCCIALIGRGAERDATRLAREQLEL